MMTDDTTTGGQRAFMIAAPSSGSGKTTVSRCLMALLTEQGYSVQPFKCGPDYIDTKFHKAVCGRPSVNLDTFMATPEHVAWLFDSYRADADIAVVEGMMGLFDGYDRDSGSSADIARLLGLPVLLVVDARSAAYSTAALLQGFRRFRPGVNIAGVIFNKVGSARHAALLRQVCDELGLPCLGCLPRMAELEQASRYLGLDFSQHSSADGLARLLAGHISVDHLLRLAAMPGGRSPAAAISGGSAHRGGRVLMAASEESFSFVYQQTVDAFGSVSTFDPETDVPCLDGIDLLYLPGGYPEKHAAALAANAAARQSVRDFAARGGRIVAECGGMMYLCQRIVTDDDDFPMCGVLPCSVSARRADRRLSLGYRRFTLDGREYRGHEFHYTQFTGPVPPSAAQVYDAKGAPVPTPVFKVGRVLASYTHLYNV